MSTNLHVLIIDMAVVTSDFWCFHSLLGQITRLIPSQQLKIDIIMSFDNR